MNVDLRAGLVSALDRLRTRLATGFHGDPHVGFAVFVYPDAEPVVIALTERGAFDMRTLVSPDAENAVEEPKRWFTFEDLVDADHALGDTAMALRYWRLGKEGEPGKIIAEEVRRRWEQRREDEVARELSKAEAERLRPSICDGCKRRFTERGLALHLSRSRSCPASRSRA